MDFNYLDELDADEDGDSDVDDEEEIRQLEAAIGEAQQDTCEAVARELKNHPSSALSQSHLTTTSLTTGSALSLTLQDLRELSSVESTLSLNKLYDEKIRRLERILRQRLVQCRLKLDDIQFVSSTNEKQEVFRYINCGRPYFRDHNNFPAPENNDAITAKNQMYDFSLVTSVPGWTVRDKNQFTNVMIQMSLNVKRKDLNNKISELEKQGVINKEVQKQIKLLRQERDNLSTKTPFVQLALPLEEEYDWDVLANNLNRRHTAHEYRCLWKLYFHPSINKTSWKNSEHNSLQTLASAHHYQDWDEIARKLDTGRTGYQCFVYFRTNMTNNCLGRKWTHEEVTYLKRLIEYFREDIYIPWGKIAAAMENRTKIQIYNKYLRLIEQRKGRFLPEEDAVILNCVERFGPNFKRITEYLTHRSMVQIRARYQVLNKMRISTVWSVEDDRKLVQIMSDPDSHMTFSEATKFFPGRNRANIRSRYVTIIRWMKKHPNLDIEHAPRRGARRLNHGQASDSLNKAIENLKNTLNTEVEIKSSRKKITRDSLESEIEDAIIATLVTEGVKNQEVKKSMYETRLVLPNQTIVTNDQLDLTNLRKCLIFLNSNLDRDLYEKSLYKEDYPNLPDNSQDISLFQVKSYSRKDTVVTIKLDDNPDIWGKGGRRPRNYVFPPHYATITGCKALMSHVTSLSMYCNSVNLQVLTKRNNILKYQLALLLDRFYILFLWPMLISNEGPGDFHSSKLRKIDSFYVRPPTLPNAPEVTIKSSTLKKFQNPDVSESIDLKEENSNKTVTTVSTTLSKYVNTNVKKMLQN
ncbi:proximal sequence element A Pbp95 [Anticarsia gemmatalis]|uniref:proximal sequence element A Pbp95 n=1 Tax=Anticarsia gemmatalis TaxID=129554 RepID=UPI003F7652C9